MAAIIRRRPAGGDDRGLSTRALPPRAQAAASESEATLLSSVAAGDLKVAYAYSTAGGSTSCSSGTISSISYTSSRGSVLSSELGLQRLLFIDAEEKAKRREHAMRLVEEFCHGDGDFAALERWLSEMGVGWVLDLAAGTSLQPDQCNLALAERWIRTLAGITESIHLMSSHSGYLVLLEERFLEEPDVPSRIQFVEAIEATVLKMLPFVDALLAAADLDATTDTAGLSNGAQALSEKLHTLLGVRDALSSASEGIQCCFHYYDSSVEMEAHQRSSDKVLSLLSEKETRLKKAIWNTMEEIRTGILMNEDDDDEWGIQTSQGSPDICKVTWSLVTYIKSLWNNYWRLNHIVRAAAELGSYVPNRHIITSFLLSAEKVKADPLTTLALEMVSSLEVKLAKRSESFPDHSLRHIFLINNTHIIQKKLHQFFSMKYKEVLGLKIEYYIQKYLQLSWTPVMSCLYNHTPRWFRKNSALPKFDLEFQKTYTAQKLCKVPNPELRTRLRKAIVKEVIPGLTRYLEDNNVTTSGVTPQEREEMLLELFEG